MRITHWQTGGEGHSRNTDFYLAAKIARAIGISSSLSQISSSNPAAKARMGAYPGPSTMRS
jgi:hypothetical protein